MNKASYSQKGVLAKWIIIFPKWGHDWFPSYFHWFSLKLFSDFTSSQLYPHPTPFTHTHTHQKIALLSLNQESRYHAGERNPFPNSSIHPPQSCPTQLPAQRGGVSQASDTHPQHSVLPFGNSFHCVHHSPSPQSEVPHSLHGKQLACVLPGPRDPSNWTLRCISQIGWTWITARWARLLSSSTHCIPEKGGEWSYWLLSAMMSQAVRDAARDWGGREGKVWLVGKAAFFLNYLLIRQRGTTEPWDLHRVDFWAIRDLCCNSHLQRCLFHRQRRRQIIIYLFILKNGWELSSVVSK